jgi:hypothetical protein
MPEFYRNCRLLTVVASDGFRISIEPTAQSDVPPCETRTHLTRDAALAEARAIVDANERVGSMAESRPGVTPRAATLEPAGPEA